jgi:L-fucose isomerase-like protein
MRKGANSLFNDNKLVLGLVPTRRQMYDPAFAIDNGRKVCAKVRELVDEDVEIVGIDWLNEEGLLFNPDDVEKVADYLIAHHVDALFMPFCNYGTEEAVARLAKKIGKPFLLYGPRDEAPPQEGTLVRQTDTQCGMFPASKVLLRYGVKFTYIENCWLDDPIFAEGLDKFIRVASVVKRLKNMRVGQIGTRPKPFLCMMIDESSMLEKLGVELVPITPTDIMKRMDDILANRKDEAKAVIDEIAQSMDISPMDEDRMYKLAAMRIAMLEVGKLYQLDAIGSECWTVYPQALGIAPCSVFGDVTNCGLPIGCETDVMCAITMSLLMAASRGKGRPFCADLTVRHPTNDNAEMIWHCGPAPVSIARKGCNPTLNNMRGWLELEHGDFTIGRLDSLNGQYSMFAGDGQIVDGPKTNGSYGWFEVDNWPRWEKNIIYGPYVHHIAGIHGHWAEVLEEACKYVDVRFDRP